MNNMRKIVLKKVLGQETIDNDPKVKLRKLKMSKYAAPDITVEESIAHSIKVLSPKHKQNDSHSFYRVF